MAFPKTDTSGRSIGFVTIALLKLSFKHFKFTIMKKLLNFVLVLALTFPAVAQHFTGESLSSSLRRDARIDELFNLKAQRIGASGDTRQIDMELASYGIKFPARVRLTRIHNKTNISFVLLEDSASESIFEKIEKIKQCNPAIEYIGIDTANHNCYVTFSHEASERELQHLLSEFHYDGYYVVETPVRQLGALSR